MLLFYICNVPFEFKKISRKNPLCIVQYSQLLLPSGHWDQPMSQDLVSWPQKRIQENWNFRIWSLWQYFVGFVLISSVDCTNVFYAHGISMCVHANCNMKQLSSSTKFCFISLKLEHHPWKDDLVFKFTHFLGSEWHLLGEPKWNFVALSRL